MKKISLALLLGAWAFTACSDDTSSIGIGVMPGEDNITAKSKVFDVRTSTVQVDSVFASTSTSYLGSIVDPEMRIRTTGSFLTQFHVPENFKLPEEALMLKDEAGGVVADSCDIRLYFEKYYGDSLATMKLNVQELSRKHILEEGQKLYTNLDPSSYLDPTTEYKKTISYAVKDMSRPDKETDGKTYFRQVVVKLPVKYATEVLRKYYAHPEYFKNSYHFIRQVCPGFYFESAGGVGSMLTTKLMALNVYFRYHSKTTAGKDTIVDGIQRFGATEEVIQTTQFDNSYPGSLTLEDLDLKTSTYVKTPSGLFTEMTLPVSDIVSGEHYTDSINQAKVTIRKYNSQTSSKYILPAPEQLLMVRKGKMKEFFEKKQLPDSKQSYLSSTFDAQLNIYQFANLSQLITDLRAERDLKAGVSKSDSREERERKYAAWEAQNPDWNKVMLIPVAATYTTSTNMYGQTIKTLQSVRHQLGLSSARLEGGSEHPLKMEVIYSRLNR